MQKACFWGVHNRKVTVLRKHGASFIYQFFFAEKVGQGVFWGELSLGAQGGPDKKFVKNRQSAWRYHFPANGDTGSTVLFFTGGCHAGKS